MDELSRRLRAASPYGDELPPQGERLLGELRARAAAPSDAHASTEVQRFAPPRAARLVLSFSGAVAALALVMLLVFVIDRPRIANAATPKPLQLVTSAETLQSPLQAVRAAALEDETTDAPPSALGTEYVGWYLQLDEDEPAPDFVQPQRVLNEPLRGGGVRTRAVAEPPRSSAGTLLSPLPNEAEAPGSVLFELRWRPGEFAAGFPKPPPNASAEMREYLEAYLIAHGHTASAGFAADDYAHAIEAMLRSWTLNDAAHRSAIEVLLDSPGGVQTAPNEISWDEGDTVLTLAAPSIGTMAVGSCATGKFCAYDGTYLSGSKLTFTSCTTHSTSALSVVRSIANARSSGVVQAKNPPGSVLATVSAGSSLGSAPLGITHLSCV